MQFGVCVCGENSGFGRWRARNSDLDYLYLFVGLGGFADEMASAVSIVHIKTVNAFFYRSEIEFGRILMSGKRRLHISLPNSEPKIAQKLYIREQKTIRGPALLVQFRQDP
jgi:hypothetical protein